MSDGREGSGADELVSDNEVRIDRRPQPPSRRSGLWMWFVLGLFGIGILYVGISSDEKATVEGPPAVRSGPDDFVPGGKRPAPLEIRNRVPEQPQTPEPTQKPSEQKPSTPQQMSPEEKLAYVRQRAPLLVSGGSLRSGAANENARVVGPDKDDGFIRDGHGAVIGVRSNAANQAGASQGFSQAQSVPGYGAGSGAAQASDTNPNDTFFDRAAARQVRTVRATPARDMQYRISEGKLISGVLETAINSDLPGRLRAMVDEDIYGEHGRIVLLPRMTRLIGEYNSSARNGQTRVFVVWRRAIRPDGSSIDLASYGTDSIGRSGLTGEVDQHFFRRFGTALLLSIIGAVATNSREGSDDTAVGLYRYEIARAVQGQATEVLRSELRIPPTIHVDQGTSIKVFVAQDLDFSEVAREQPLPARVHLEAAAGARP